jgi:anti-sigma B factor antagonist
MDLRWRVRATENISVIEIDGEVDLHSAPELRSELHRLTEPRAPRVVVDLGGVTFIDSTGIGVLVGGLRRAREKGGSLAFCAAQPRVRRVFEITGLLRALPLHTTRDEAARAVGETSAAPATSQGNSDVS